jgi:uracil-DNA glycosylase
MTTNIDINDIKEKLNAKLIDSGWARVLRGFIYSTEFDNILLKLIKDSQEDRRFTPFMKYLFRAFEETPYTDLKVVIVGQDPYPGIEQADGIAFSCSFEKKALPSLRFILDAVNRTVYKDEYYSGSLVSTDIDLKRWSNQGILMINSALTCTIGKPGSHSELWKPMMAYLLDYLNSYNPGLIYVFMGKKAQEDSVHINNNCYKFFVSHPASAAYSHLKEWDCQDVFHKVADLTKKNYNFDIKW